MELIQIGGSFADTKKEIAGRDLVRKDHDKEETRIEKEKEKAKKALKKAKKELKKAKLEAKKAKKEAKKENIQIPEKAAETTETTTAAVATEIPEVKCSTRVELIMTDKETGTSQVLVSTDYGDSPAVVPPRENVPVVTLPEDGRVTDASLEEKIRAAAARKGITLEASESPIVAALASASAANVKKGSNTPRNVGRNVVRINQ